MLSGEGASRHYLANPTHKLEKLPPQLKQAKNIDSSWFEGWISYSLILSNVETTCHNKVRIWDCICGFWVTLSSILIVFAALTEIDPFFSSFIPVRISLTIFRIFFWILLFLAILSKVLIAFASLSWFSLSLISFFEAIDVNTLHFFYLTKQWLLNVFPISSNTILY